MSIIRDKVCNKERGEKQYEKNKFCYVLFIFYNDWL